MTGRIPWLLLATTFTSLLAMPDTAHAQNVVGTFRAQYTWFLPYPDPSNPTQVGPHRVRFTLYDNDTWTNTDGNGGEYSVNSASGAVTFWFFSEAEATLTYPPIGAATWEGTLVGGRVCNGTTRSPGIDPASGYPITVNGVWNTRGCP